MDIKHLHLHEMQINFIMGFIFVFHVSPKTFTHTTLI
jgi:hypothetical protein